MKITILTQIFPTDDKRKDSTYTKVVYYFAQSWIKRGHEVVIYHCPNVLAKPVYYLPKRVKDIIKGKLGCEIANPEILKYEHYTYHDVQVVRVPFFKPIPRCMATKRSIHRGSDYIVKDLKKRNFSPDLIISHFISPCLPVDINLKKNFPEARASLVVHEAHYFVGDKYGINCLFNSIDAIGTRSLPMSKRLKEELGISALPYVCYSGVNDDYVRNTPLNAEKVKDSISRFLYAGDLMARKHVDTIIKALTKSELPNWKLDIVGHGSIESELKELAKSLGVESNVHFHGRVSRNEVQEYIEGKEKVFGFFVGQIMKATKGKANPKMVNELLRSKLDSLKPGN